MNKKQKVKVKEVYDLLMSLQPHIPQACYPSHVSYIDNYVDPAVDILRELLTENNKRNRQ